MKLGTARYRLCAVAVISILLMVTPTSDLAGASSILKRSDCRDHIVVNYAAPLKKMRRIHEVPQRGGRLPFAPASVSLESFTGSVVPGSSRVGFFLGVPDADPQAWVKGIFGETRVVVVNKSGASRRVLASRRTALSRLLSRKRESYTLGPLSVPGTPRFYRLDVIFKKWTGARLATYSQYFRVVPVRTRVSIAVSDASPGARLVWRLENQGTTGLIYGLLAAVERHSGFGWVATDLLPSGAPDVAITLPGGFAGACESVKLPDTLEPGSYRIRKDVELGKGERSVFGRFTIAPHSS